MCFYVRGVASPSNPKQELKPPNCDKYETALTKEAARARRRSSARCLRPRDGPSTECQPRTRVTRTLLQVRV